MPERRMSTNLFPRLAFKSIRTRMALVFVIFTSVVLVAVIYGLLYGLPGNLFNGWQEQQKREVYDSLNLTADFKRHQLLEWIETNRKLMSIATTNRTYDYQIETLLATVQRMKQTGVTDWRVKIISDPNYNTLRYELLEMKKVFGPSHQISIVDVDGGGDIVVSSNETQVGENVSWEDFYPKMLSNTDEYLGEAHEDLRSQSPVLNFSRPVRNEDGKLIAILLLELDPSEILTPLLETGAGLGTTGEIVLVNQDRMILTYLRHSLPDGSIAVPLMYQNPGIPAMHAANGENGITEAKDYRGVMVLAAYRFIDVTPEWGWGLVVKKDLAEVYAPVQRSIFFSIAMGVTSILLIILVTIYLSSSLTKPLLEVSQAAQKYTEGDLGVRIDASGNDEVGLLAKSFNSMAARLQDWYGEMEQRVKSRTEEITAVNEQLKTEIEQRKRIEGELRETRDYLENLLKYANAPIIVWDAENRITRFNRAFEHLSGRNAADVLGSSIDQIFPSGQQAHMHTLLQNAGRGERWESVEIPIHHVDGSARIVLWNSATIFSNNGVIPLGTIAQGLDITERKKAEEIQAQLSHELAEKNDELEQIVYVTSHDLRSPLVNIQGFSKELDMSIKDISQAMDVDGFPPSVLDKVLPIIQKEIPQALGYIQTSTIKMDSLISGLLKLSRLGRAVLNIVPLDMDELIRNVLYALEYQIKVDGIQINVEKLPVCLGDAVLINQVFTNLVDNAIKYLQPGRAGVISITGRKANRNRDGEHIPQGKDYVVYCVQDNGIGIAAAHLAKIFEIFHRLDPQGTFGEGLGLTIVRHTLDRQQGRIWVESLPGEGSKFFVALPHGNNS